MKIINQKGLEQEIDEMARDFLVLNKEDIEEGVREQGDNYNVAGEAYEYWIYRRDWVADYYEEENEEEESVNLDEIIYPLFKKRMWELYDEYIESNLQ